MLRWMLVALALTGVAPARGQEAPAAGEEGGRARSLGVVVPATAGLDAEAQASVVEALWAEALMHSGPGLAWRLQLWGGLGGELDEAQALAALHQDLERGKQAYRYLKLDEAQQIFEGALARLDRRPLLGCQASQVAQLYQYWARAVLDSGEAAGAQALLGQVQRFEPRALPDPAVMPPNLVATFDVALDERRSLPRGQVLIEAGPGRASLRLDCQPQPAGVVQWNGVAGEGLWLAAEVEGGVVRARLTVPAGARRELVLWSGQPGQQAELRSLLGSLAAPAAGQASAGLERLAALTGVELLLVAEGRPAGGLRLGLASPRRGLLGAIVEVPAAASGRPEPERLRAAVAELAERARSPELLATLAAPAGPAAGAAEPPPAVTATQDAVEPAPPWYETWWFWTAVGGVVAAGLVTGLVVGLAGSEEPSGNVVITLGQP